MTVQAKIRTIKSICWVGAGADALWTVALVRPQLYGILTHKPALQPDLNMQLAMGIGASLMAGWTLLLAWTAGSPVQRRIVMLLTGIPVVMGLAIVAGIGIFNGHDGNKWILGKCIVLSIAMLKGYLMASTIAKEGANENDH